MNSRQRRKQRRKLKAQLQKDYPIKSIFSIDTPVISRAIARFQEKFVEYTKTALIVLILKKITEYRTHDLQY